jgi:hypothetical protein
MSAWFGCKVIRLKAPLFVIDRRQFEVYTFYKNG